MTSNGFTLLPKGQTEADAAAAAQRVSATATAGLWLMLAGAGLFGWLPSLGRAHGVGLPALVEPAALGLYVLGATSVLLAGKGLVYLSPALAWTFFVPVSLMAISDFAKQDFGHLTAVATFLYGLLALSVARLELLIRVLAQFLMIVASASLLASLAFPYANFAGRDFLPLLIEGRAVGLMGHPNSFAIACALLVFMSAVLSGRQRVVSIAVGLVGMFAAASQTTLAAMAAAATCAAGWYAFQHARTRLARVLVLGVSIAVLTWAACAVWGQARYVLENDAVLTGRAIIWRYLSATDPGLWGLAKHDFLAATQAAKGVGSAHNHFMQLFYLYGYPGALAYVLSIGAFFMLAARYRSALVGALGIYYAVVGLAEGVLWAFPHVLLFPAVAIALFGAHAAPGTSRRPRSHVPQQRMSRLVLERRALDAPVEWGSRATPELPSTQALVIVKREEES